MNKKIDLDNIIAAIKEELNNTETTREYIEIIRQYIKNMIDNYGDEKPVEEIIKDFIEYYDSEMLVNTSGEQIYQNMIQYKAMKELINDSKGNKHAFRMAIKDAIAQERENGTGNITLGNTTQERINAIIRSVIRVTGKVKENEILGEIQDRKTIFNKDLRKAIIKRIQWFAAFLNDYGIIDRYIEDSNKELEGLGLEELKYNKRNPLPDEYIGIPKDSEDIGVLDSLDETNLEDIPLEELVIMLTFYESKYLETKLELSKAMSVIDTLGIWQELVENDENYVQKLDEQKLEDALKKDLTLAYIYKNSTQITKKMKKQYEKFTKKKEIHTGDIEEDLKKSEKRNNDLHNAAYDITYLQCLLLNLLHSKQLKLKNWGKVESKKVELGDDVVVIGMDIPNLRGTNLMAIPKGILEAALGIKSDSIPEFKGYIDEHYSNVMSKICVPATNYFKNLVQKKYKGNQTSELYAALAGKKAKNGEAR